MNWFLYAISGYFLYAASTVADKFLLRQRATTNPIAYNFYIGILGVFAFVLAPFGLAWPGFWQFALDIFAGILFFLGLLFFYQALDINEPSRVTSIIGSLVPVLVLFFSYIFLAERLGFTQIMAFFLLVLGGFLISFKKLKSGLAGAMNGKKYIIFAILTYAVYLILTKYIFIQQGFVTGFLWTRFGAFLAAISVLLYPGWRKVIFSSAAQTSFGLGSLLIFAKVSAGIGSFFVHLAISRGSVSVINAMQGAEYAFLLILAIVFSKKFPQILKEEISGGILIQKIFAIILIGFGLSLLSL